MTIAFSSRSPHRFAFGPTAACLLTVLVAAATLPAAAAPPQDVDDSTAAAPQEEGVPQEEISPPEEVTPQEEIPPQEEVQAPAPDPHAVALDRAQATMGRLLEVGRALHAWARDTRLERGRRQPAARMPKQARWERCPGIEHGELEAMLVPAYLRELPSEDAWERPLQFCLDRRLAGSESQYGIRSAGSDGTYSADPYQVGGFPDNRLEGDLVWMDGYFIRWPEPQ
jgi:hypothetical protein